MNDVEQSDQSGRNMRAFPAPLHAVLSTALDAAIAMTEDGRVVGWNRIAEQMFGWTLAEVEGRPLSEFIIPLDVRALHETGLRRYLQTGVAKALGRHIEVEAVSREGRLFPVELSTTEISLSDERIFIGFIRDISARKEAEIKLADMSQRLDLAVRAHHIGIFDTDVATGQVNWSDELQLIYGYSPGDFGATLDDWRKHVVPSDLARVEAQFRDAISCQATDLSYSYRITTCEGHIRDIEASARLFYDSDGTHVRRVGVNIDVTDRKIDKRRLAESQAELIHLSGLNSLAAMASSLSHELNQPLGAAANYIETAKILLEKQAEINRDPVVLALEAASEATLHAGDLIRKLRLLSSKAVAKPIEVSLTDLVNQTASIVLQEPRFARVAIELAIDPGADRFRADPILLQQVLFNLLVNAAEASTDPHTSIIVQASLRASGEVLVEVADSGPGIDPVIETKLFKAFVGTKEDRLGLGLSICRTIIENTGGRIWAANNEVGASFFFTLPQGAVG